MLMEKLIGEVVRHERLAVAALLAKDILGFPARSEWYRKKGFKSLDEMGIQLGKHLTKCF